MQKVAMVADKHKLYKGTKGVLQLKGHNGS